jgi:hypothetical protein
MISIVFMIFNFFMNLGLSMIVVFTYEMFVNLELTRVFMSYHFDLLMLYELVIEMRLLNCLVFIALLFLISLFFYTQTQR